MLKSNERGMPPITPLLNEMPIQVAIVEDKQSERESLERLLRGRLGITCMVAAKSGEEALKLIPPRHPNIVLMDIQLPGMSGIECVRRLKPLCPDVQVMMLTVIEDHERIFEALAAGAMGYLLKNTPPAKLIEAIEELHNGGAPMSGQIARQVIAVFQKNRFPPSDAKLSPQEEKILQLLARGLLYKEIADELGLKPSTVRTHIWHIYAKLHVNNRTEAVRKGLGRFFG